MEFGAGPVAPAIESEVLKGHATATLTATVSGGTAPYSHQWTLTDGFDLDDVPPLGTSTSISVPLPLGVFTFKVTVTDRNRATKSAYTHVTVQLPTIAGPKSDKGRQRRHRRPGLKAYRV